MGSEGIAGFAVSMEGEIAVERDTSAQGLEMVRRAVHEPEAPSLLSSDRLHSELSRLKTRLEHVQSRGGAYRRVDLSLSAHELLARLEAGALLSTQVH